MAPGERLSRSRNSSRQNLAGADQKRVFIAAQIDQVLGPGEAEHGIEINRS